MLSLYCTAHGFISKKKEYNPEEIIPNSRYLRNLILQKVVKKKKKLECSDYLLLFPMRVYDDEQHFN